jgi:hypothetical protein
MDRVSLLADATEGATVGDGTRADDSAESVAQYERRSESGVRGDLFDGQGRGFEKRRRLFTSHTLTFDLSRMYAQR